MDAMHGALVAAAVVMAILTLLALWWSDQSAKEEQRAKLELQQTKQDLQKYHCDLAVEKDYAEEICGEADRHLKCISAMDEALTALVDERDAIRADCAGLQTRLESLSKLYAGCNEERTALASKLAKDGHTITLLRSDVALASRMIAELTEKLDVVHVTLNAVRASVGYYDTSREDA